MDIDTVKKRRPKDLLFLCQEKPAKPAKSKAGDLKLGSGFYKRKADQRQLLRLDPGPIRSRSGRQRGGSSIRSGRPAAVDRQQLRQLLRLDPVPTRKAFCLDPVRLDPLRRDPRQKVRQIRQGAADPGRGYIKID